MSEQPWCVPFVNSRTPMILVYAFLWYPYQKEPAGLESLKSRKAFLTSLTTAVAFCTKTKSKCSWPALKTAKVARFQLKLDSNSSLELAIPLQFLKSLNLAIPIHGEMVLNLSWNWNWVTFEDGRCLESNLIVHISRRHGGSWNQVRAAQRSKRP